MIKIAQIGVGYWGPNLLRNLATNTKCELVTVCDLSKDRQDFVKKSYPNILVTDKIDAILQDPEINAIVIATPVSTHFNLIMKALEAGKHVLVEKPMASNIDQVDQIANLSKKKNLIVMVGHTFLYNSAVRYVKKVIDSGDLGDIRYIYSQRVNLGRLRNDVDALWNLAPHDISIVQYWLNEIKPIHVSKIGIDYVQKGIDDVAFLNIIYPKNIMVNIHVSWLDPHKIRSMTIVGSKKMIVYDDIADDKIVVYDKGIDRIPNLGEQMDFDDPNTFSFNHRSGDVFVPKINWEEPLKIEVQHFIDCIIEGKKCITGTDHAKTVVKILEMGTLDAYKDK